MQNKIYNFYVEEMFNTMGSIGKSKTLLIKRKLCSDFVQGFDFMVHELS